MVSAWMVRGASGIWDVIQQRGSLAEALAVAEQWEAGSVG
jgi:hypothetical protein